MVCVERYLVMSVDASAGLRHKLETCKEKITKSGTVRTISLGDIIFPTYPILDEKSVLSCSKQHTTGTDSEKSQDENSCSRSVSVPECSSRSFKRLFSELNPAGARDAIIAPQAAAALPR
jgi:hypothetical protein